MLRCRWAGKRVKGRRGSVRRPDLCEGANRSTTVRRRKASPSTITTTTSAASRPPPRPRAVALEDSRGSGARRLFAAVAAPPRGRDGRRRRAPKRRRLLKRARGRVAGRRARPTLDGACPDRPVAPHARNFERRRCRGGPPPTGKGPSDDRTRPTASPRSSPSAGVPGPLESWPRSVRRGRTLCRSCVT